MNTKVSLSSYAKKPRSGETQGAQQSTYGVHLLHGGAQWEALLYSCLAQLDIGWSSPTGRSWRVPKIYDFDGTKMWARPLKSFFCPQHPLKSMKIHGA